jgi:hypothetical protein
MKMYLIMNLISCYTWKNDENFVWRLIWKNDEDFILHISIEVFGNLLILFSHYISKIFGSLLFLFYQFETAVLQLCFFKNSVVGTLLQLCFINLKLLQLYCNLRTVVLQFWKLTGFALLWIIFYITIIYVLFI